MSDKPPVQSKGEDGCPTYTSPGGGPFSPGALLGAGLNFIGASGGALTGGLVSKGLSSLFRNPAHAREAAAYFHVRQVRRERVEARRLASLAASGDRRAEARLQNFNLITGAGDELLKAGEGALRGAGCAAMGVGCGSPGQPPGDVMTDVANTIVAAAIVSAILDCEGSLNVGQTLEVDCGTPAGGAAAFPSNDGCAACGRALDAVVAARRDMVLGSGLPTPEDEEDPNSAVFRRINAVGGEGPCAAACENCVARSVNQSVAVRFTTGCNSSSSWRSQIQDNVGTMVTSSVSQINDALGSLAGILSADHECIRKDLTNAIRTRVTQEFVNKIRVKMDNWQSLKVAGGSASVWMSKASEGINVTSVIDIVAGEQITDNLYSAEETRAAAEFVQQNATINEFADDVNDIFSGVGDLVGSTFGTMLIVMAAVLSAMALGLALLWVVNPSAVRSLLSGGVVD
jgi:hypothetical protein